MIAKDMLEHQLWTIGMGHRPNIGTVRRILESHIQALEELDAAREKVKALQYETLFPEPRCDFDCDNCREDPMDYPEDKT